MSTPKDLRSFSRNDFTMVNPDTEHLILGCLQRIADTLESVTKNYRDIIAERDFYERRMKEEQFINANLIKGVQMHQRHIKRLKTINKNLKS